MVLKARSENTIQPLRNVKNFSSWTLPSLDGGTAPGYKQPVEEVVEDPKVVAEELAKIQAQELKTIKEEAFKEGFNSGQKAGLAAAKNEIDKQINSVRNLIDELSDPIKQCGEQTQQELLQLAFAVARQIVRRELKQDPSQLIAIIREALRLLPIGSQKIEIALHPDDALMLKNSFSIETESDSNRWKIKEDPVIERGGCLVTTKNSKIDASINKQVAILFNRIAGGLRADEQNSHLDIESTSDSESTNSPEATPSRESISSPETITPASTSPESTSAPESISSPKPIPNPGEMNSPASTEPSELDSNDGMTNHFDSNEEIKSESSSLSEERKDVLIDTDIQPEDDLKDE